MAGFSCVAMIMLVTSVSATGTCNPSKGHSCAAEGPRAGGAMIQANADKKNAPLKGRLVTLTAEVDGLEGRIGALKTEVGAAGGAPATESLALIAKDIKVHEASASSSLYADYSALLRSKTNADSLKDTVGELETRMGKVKSDIQMLENQVSGNAFSAESLLATDTKVQKAAGSSLDSRTSALESEVVDARTRVTSIEQTVVG